MNRQTSWPHLVAVVGFVLLVAVVASESPDVLADPNDRGQVVFGATLSDDREVLLVATPKSHKRHD